MSAMGSTPARDDSPESSGLPTGGGPLAGLIILDLSRVLAGPLATQQLVDLGARVIKVEPPNGGDATRGWGPPFVDDDRSAYYLCANRGKESIALDLRTDAGRTILERLVARADAVIENFRPQVWEHWGLSLAEWRRRYPGLVTCTISGFGTWGPRAGEGGYDAVVQAMSGLMAITGPVDGPASKIGVAVVDILTGAYATSGLLALLHAREQFVDRPDGRHCEVTLYESALQLLANVATGVLLTGEEAKRWGNGHPMIVPYQTFPTRDGDVFIAVGNDQQFQRLARVLERRDWERRAEWGTNAGRVEDRASVVGAIAEATQHWTRDELVLALEAAEVPAGPVRGVREAFADPVVDERCAVLEHSDGTRTVRSPVRGPDVPAIPPPPHLGQHSDALLVELGFDRAEIDALISARVVRVGRSWEPPPDGSDHTRSSAR